MKALLVYRAPQFSPNSIEKDRAILEETGRLLMCEDFEVVYVHEEELTEVGDAGLVLTMGRLPETVRRLEAAEQRGIRVLNTAAGLARSSRIEIDRLMRTHGIPAAPLFSHGEAVTRQYWVKRGDQSAQNKDDVRFAEDDGQLRQTVNDFHRRGITQLVVTEHVEGDLVKFYGVAGTGFFRTYYPTDDGQTKFCDELRNGSSHHYAYNGDALQGDAEHLSRLTGLPIYGGDAIVRRDGTYALIDFNDWPSFSRCREEAARAIVRLVQQ